MAILKLQPGREHAIAGTVSQVFLEPSKNPKFKDQYKIVLSSGDLLYLDKDAVERQAARLQKLPNELAGESLTFWKKPMNDDPTRGFLNIDLGAQTNYGATAANAARDEQYVARDLSRVGVAMPTTTYEDIKVKYAESLGDAIGLLNDTTESLGVVFTPAEMLAAAATLFIERSKRGV